MSNPSLPHPMPAPAPTSLRVGLVACLIVVWALVCAAWMGPKASLAQCLVPFIGGLLTVAGFYMGYWWVKDTIGDEWRGDAVPYQSNLSWLWSVVLVFVLIGLAIVWQVCIAEPLRRIRKWHRQRYGDISGAELIERAKALEGERPRMRW